MPLFLVLALAAHTGAPPAATSAIDRIVCSKPVTVAELDSRKLHGHIVQMAWSADGTKLYLQTAETGHDGKTETRHYLLAADSDAKPERVETEPDWAWIYWIRKSSDAEPGSKTSFKVTVESHQQTLHSTVVSMGGAMATGAAQGTTTVNDVTTAIRGEQTVYITELRAAHHTIGSWTDKAAQPGFTFGWAPASLGLLAYADPEHDGRLVLLDAQGHTRNLDGTKHAVLPAWSDDGTRLAFLQRDGHNKYRLRIIHVTARS